MVLPGLGKWGCDWLAKRKRLNQHSVPQLCFWPQPPARALVPRLDLTRLGRKHDLTKEMICMRYEPATAAWLEKQRQRVETSQFQDQSASHAAKVSPRAACMQYVQYSRVQYSTEPEMPTGEVTAYRTRISANTTTSQARPPHHERSPYRRNAILQ